MNERVRKRGGAAPRSTGPSLTPLPRRIENPWAPLGSLSEEAIENLLDAAYRILEEGGLEFRSTRALDLLRRSGAIEGEDGLVRLPREVVEHYRALAPRSFTLHSRNPAKAVEMGGNVLNFCTANGAPMVSDRLRGRRYGDLAALTDIVRLNNALGAVHISGGEVVEPTDIPVPLRPVIWPMPISPTATSSGPLAASAVPRSSTPCAWPACRAGSPRTTSRVTRPSTSSPTPTPPAASTRSCWRAP
jgi:trimethylamine--corrinoid protein Co-methyltransferase